ncbi:hypothetical protein A3L12_07405 [Thermococcus sp. P6]|uniref:iron-sulfur cluster assembly protein n=1 Tax=Thermococcus sp. P6 TaxID=122420 RepID=UPI000B59C0F9|nr:iron-sulfur cluster assembly protein [Thermococcus sp. P6]ASJ11137.1 hypothetical protein A3L12_07405 [Thermococcus sp. P6]
MGLFEILKRKPKKGPKKDLPLEVSAVVQLLRNVKDPETELDIVDEGLLYGLTVEGKNVDVFLLLARSTPECHFCQVMAINVQKKIVKDTIQILKEKGFNKVRVYNELGLLLEEG